MAAFNFYINRMLSLPITKYAKQQEWKVILAIAQYNGFPLQIIHNLKKKQTDKNQNFQPQQLKSSIFIPQSTNTKKITYHSPLIHKITYLFKHTNLNIALRATNTIHQQLDVKTVMTSTNSSGIYKLKCNTCSNSFVGYF